MIFESLPVSVRKTLVGDHDWMHLYMAKMRPMVAKQQAVVFKQFDWYPLKNPQSSTNLYELIVSRAIPGQASNCKCSLPFSHFTHFQKKGRSSTKLVFKTMKNTTALLVYGIHILVN